MASFPQVSPPKPWIRLSSPPYALHAPPLSLFSILSPEQYWVSSTDLIVQYRNRCTFCLLALKLGVERKCCHVSRGINENMVLLQRLSVLSLTQLYLYGASQSFSWTRNALHSVRHKGSLPHTHQPATDTTCRPDEPVCVVTLCFHSDHNTVIFTIYA